MHLFPTVLNCMDATIDYMDSTRIGPFHTMQLLNIFNNAANRKWDNFKQSLASYNGPLNVTNSEGHTLVQVAILGNQEECVSTLITKGASLNCYDTSKKPTTPLHCAAYNGYTKIAQLLINADKTIIDLTDPTHGNTALHFAAWSNHAEIVQMLIAAKACMSKTNKFGSTPVHSAAWKNSTESLKVLLACGANATQPNTTGIGNTPLYLAAKAGSNDCLQFLIDDLKIKLEPYAFINYLDQECAADNSTAIQAAAGRKNLQCYWNLVLVDGDYRAKTKSEKRSYFSEEITENAPVKKFIETIEQKGKNNPPHYQGANSACYTCNIDYKNNDVVVGLTSCNHSFHVSCFKNHALEKTIIQCQDTPGIQFYLKQDKSPQDIRHDILNNPWTPIDWEMVKECPHCLNPASFNKVGNITVFSMS